MLRRWPRWAKLLAAIVVAGALVSAIRPIREPVLRAAGWILIVHDPVEPADIIVVAADPGGGGLLEAADLVHGGIATRVAVFEDPPDAVDREYLRRGIPYEDAALRWTRQLRSLGVTAVEQIPKAVPGSEAESAALRDWCQKRQFRSIVVVSSPDHSRRLRRILRRTLQGLPTRIAIRPTRYSLFDPDHWWQTRDGIRTEIIELQKLLLDVVRHPLS